jgi:hypothetical protein
MKLTTHFPSSVEVNNAPHYTSTPPYVSMALMLLYYISGKILFIFCKLKHSHKNTYTHIFEKKFTAVVKDISENLE